MIVRAGCSPLSSTAGCDVVLGKSVSKAALGGTKDDLQVSCVLQCVAVSCSVLQCVAVSIALKRATIGGVTV